MLRREKPTPAVGERRKFPRVAVTCDVKYRPVDLEDGVRELRENSPAVMKNISGGGICFVASDRQRPGQMLALEVWLPGFPSAVVSYGRVSWCERREDGRFDVGVEFWWIGWNDEDAQHNIRAFLADALGDDDNVTREPQND